MSKKRGKFSKEEQRFIVENVHDLTLDEIADKLNRHLDPIKRFIKENNLISYHTNAEEAQLIELRALLRSRPYWIEVRGQLLDSEVEYFERSWIQFMKQFNADVQFSEELQMKQWIILDILIDRGMRERKAFLEEQERLVEELDQLQSVEKDCQTIEEKRHLEHMRTELNRVRAAITAYNNDHVKLLSEQKYIAKDMKATRDKRIKIIEDGHESWGGLLKMLEDETVKQQIGEEIEIFRMAKDAAKKRLTEYHEYIDGQVDQPLLTSKTLKEE